MYKIGTPEFIKNLEGWLEKNDQKYADWLYRNKSGIPPIFRQYGSYLYRGMSVSESDFENIKNSGLSFQKHTSWSKDPSIAKKFVSDPKYSIGPEKPIKILIKKKISSSNIILDIHAMVMFMGIKELELLGLDELASDSAINEQEVLISRGLRVSKNDITQF